MSEIIGPYLRKRGDLIAFWCPGCGHAHILNTDGERPRWSFDGNAEAPSFHPSVKVSWPGDGKRPERVRCHLFVRKGQIEYLDDSAGHQLRGRHPMTPFPPGYGGWSDDE